MPLAEKGVRGKGRQPFAPPQHTEPRSAKSAPSGRPDMKTCSRLLIMEHGQVYSSRLLRFAGHISSRIC
jgi:hypothetical protein